MVTPTFIRLGIGLDIFALSMVSEKMINKWRKCVFPSFILILCAKEYWVNKKPTLLVGLNGSSSRA
jgi:hypothetical protein